MRSGRLEIVDLRGIREQGCLGQLFDLIDVDGRQDGIGWRKRDTIVTVAEENDVRGFEFELRRGRVQGRAESHVAGVYIRKQFPQRKIVRALPFGFCAIEPAAPMDDAAVGRTRSGSETLAIVVVPIK